ncbi:MAG: MarR family transcriptional regulator [Candidatus Hydrogenedentes bacterium]|nr:MarR family transcriptional regulator [Candidatus Hydrogenedentota bacterium]
MSSNDCEEVVMELRKIIRSLDLHSRWLNREYALTSPQLVFLKEIAGRDGITIGNLARRTSLSCATATGIVDRLEQRGLVSRSRNGKDRRQVQLTLTASGRDTCARRPPVLQENFLRALEDLPAAEKQRMLESLRLLADMMSGIVDRQLPQSVRMQEQQTHDQPEIRLPSQASPAGFLESCRMLLAGKLPEDASEAGAVDNGPDGLALHVVRSVSELAQHVTVEGLVAFLHEHLKPYEDTEEAIRDGIAYALSDEPGKGGFVLLAERRRALVGALVMLRTGMHGYVPPNLLLFVAAHAACRSQGIGGWLVRKAQSLAGGDVKLHVEYQNPARHLYERLGFASKYAEMRWAHEPRDH